MSTYFLLDPFVFLGDSKLHSVRITSIHSILNHKKYSRLMMAQSRAESTRDTYNYGQYINQFPSNTIKEIRKFKRIQKKICRHKMSIMFNKICIYIYIYATKFCLRPQGFLKLLQSNNHQAVKKMKRFENRKIVKKPSGFCRNLYVCLCVCVCVCGVCECLSGL